jgi:hypothetical protein
VFAALQLPNPSQLDTVSVPAAQASALHVVPLTCRRHAPAPLQKPSCLQVEESSGAHSLSGSVALATFPHTPSTPDPFLAAEQARQEPPHGASQQKPSMQLLLAHWVLDVHAAPTA